MAREFSGSSRPPIIGVSGSYGGLNIGDEAILASIVEQLRAALPGVEFTVFSRDAEHTRTHHDVECVVGAREALRDQMEQEIARCDLLLLGGGGMLYDREAESYLHALRIAQELSVPTATFAIGAGPLERTSDRHAVVDVLNRMKLVTVRDVKSKRLLEHIGVDKDIIVTGDPALLLPPEPFTQEMLHAEGVSTERRLVGMSVREPGGAVEIDQTSYPVLLANAADFIADRFDADLVFIPMERLDIRECHRVIGEMAFADRAKVLHGRYRPHQVLGLTQHLQLVVGMRLHLLIFAASARVPLLALPYASKVTSFLESLGVPTPQLVQREHAGALLAAIDRIWDLRQEHRVLLEQRVPELQRRAATTAWYCMELLEHTRPPKEPEPTDAAASKV